jgi:hypothetical protein
VLKILIDPLLPDKLSRDNGRSGGYLQARTRHREVTDEAIVVTDQAAGTAGMKLVERPEPQDALALPAVRRRSTSAHRSSSTSITMP